MESIQNYYKNFTEEEKAICERLTAAINNHLPASESKIWHSHPVWFINENPIVGFSKQKQGIRLMFWSGKSFDEEGLSVTGGKFQDASVFYNKASEVKLSDLKRWLKKSITIQWDYKNIVKRKGKLIRLDI